MATEVQPLPTAAELKEARAALSTALDALHRVVHQAASVGNLIDEGDTAELAARAAPRPTLEDIGRIYLFMRERRIVCRADHRHGRHARAEADDGRRGPPRDPRR